MLRIWKSPGDFSPKTLSMMLTLLFAAGFMWFADTQAVSASGITVTKTANISPTITGEVITFTVNVSYTNIAATAVAETIDPLAPNCSRPLPVFTGAPPIPAVVSNMVSYECTMLVEQTEDFVNVITATVPSSNGNGVLSSDPYSEPVAVINPAIEIAKLPAEQTLAVGEIATFTIILTNTGNITLTDIVVDDELVPDCNGVDSTTLGPGEQTSATCSMIALEDFDNIATVTANAEVVQISNHAPITRTIDAIATSNPASVDVIRDEPPICVEGIVINHEEKRVAEVPVYARLDGIEIQTTSDDEAEFQFDIPNAGEWTFGLGENLPSDWLPVTSSTFSINLEAGQDACYQIRFKIKRVRQVIVTKFNDAYTPLPDWIITATPGAENLFAEVVTSTTGIDGAAIFTLTEGLWTFTEAVPDGSDISYIPIIPKNGYQELTIDGEKPYDPPYQIYFKNRIVSNGACIDIHKQDDPEGFGIQGWYMEVLRVDGTLAAMGYTDAEGTLSLEGLPYGPYTIVEESRLGWEPINGPRIDVDLQPNAVCESITFTNRQKPPVYCVEGRKIDINGRYGLPDWEITIKPVEESGYQNEPESVQTDGLGRYSFEFPSNDYRIPGSAYEICEVQQDGWVTAFTPECQVVHLPQEPGICVQVPDFVNAQVGHDLTQYHTPVPTATPTVPATPTYVPPAATPTATPTDTPSQPTVIPPTVTPVPQMPYPTATPTDRPSGQQSPDDGPAGPEGKLPSGSKADGANNGPAYTQVNSHDPECQSYHIVQPGEGLSTIAAHYGLYHRDMLRCNGWVSNQKNGWVYPGQRLCVPYH